MEFKKEDMIDLNEQNVQRLFAYCLADSATPSENIVKRNFFEDNSQVKIPDMAFDKTKISKILKTVCYLLGQLFPVHNGTANMLPTDGFKKYNGTNWTKNRAALFALYYLGDATETLPKFEYFPPLKNYTSPIDKYYHILTPTLSPNDPNFKE